MRFLPTIRPLVRCTPALLLLIVLSGCRTGPVNAQRAAAAQPGAANTSPASPAAATPRVPRPDRTAAAPTADDQARRDAYREPGNALLERSEDLPLSIPGLGGPRDPWTLSVSGTTGYIVGGSGGPSAFTNAAALSLIHRFHIFSTLTLNVAYNRRDYDFDDNRGLFAGLGDAPGQLHTVAGTASLFQPLSEKWAVFLSAGVAGSTEVGVEVFDDPSFIGIFVIGTQVNPKLQLGVGVLATVRPEEDPFFLPIPQFTWNISDRWTLATEDAGGGFTYEVNPKLELSGMLKFDTRRYRLDVKGPGTPGIFEDSRTSLIFRARWLPNEDVRFNLVGGLDIIRYLEVADEDGRVLRDENAGLGGFFRVSFSVAF